MKFSPDSIATGTRGRLVQGGVVGRVCTDTRAIAPGDWFLALKGERFDAHDFLDAAVQAGACGVIAERVPEGWSAGWVPRRGRTRSAAEPRSTRASGIRRCPVVSSLEAQGRPPPAHSSGSSWSRWARFTKPKATSTITSASPSPSWRRRGRR